MKHLEIHVLKHRVEEFYLFQVLGDGDDQGYNRVYLLYSSEEGRVWRWMFPDVKIILAVLLVLKSKLLSINHTMSSET